jgi:hypothetical protein
MRRRITRTLVAAAAAAVTAAALASAAAGAADAAPTGEASPTNPASGGAPIYTPQCSSFQLAFNLGGCSGYVASGRDFRLAQSIIMTPMGPGDVTSPTLFIALSSVDSVAGAGIISCAVALNEFSYTCPTGDTYAAFGTTSQQSFILFSHFVPLSPVTGGSGVFFSIYDNVAGNELHFVITLPDGTTSAFGLDAHGAVYTVAAAVADWNGATPSSPAQPLAKARVGQFLRGRFTTVSGQQGTFGGPWTLSQLEVTSNGSAPPGGDLISAPSPLWTDGNSLGHLTGDAFGTWLYSQ